MSIASSKGTENTCYPMWFHW